MSFLLLSYYYLTYKYLISSANYWSWKMKILAVVVSCWLVEAVWMFCEQECKVTEKGYIYRGTVNRTIGGFTCQQWGTQYPHRHYYSKLQSENNYCRNPDNEPKPWCYTTERYKLRDYCDIPLCDSDNLVPCEKRECKETMKGLSYRGSLDKTVSGLTCQRWDQQHPHKHLYSESLRTANNYCRNPSFHKMPWCYTTSEHKRWEYCDIPICRDSCKITKQGKEYKGTAHKTVSGMPCQHWSSQKPHKHTIEGMEKEENYCRNPDGHPNGPWCFTTGEKRWEYCDIPFCNKRV